MPSLHRPPAAAALLLLGAAGALAQEPARRSPIVPTDWLVLPETGEVSERFLAPDPVFARYLLDPAASAPEPDDILILADGEERRWEEQESSEDGEVGAAGGYAFTSVAAPETAIWMARLSGAENLYVNGDGFVGDAFRRGFEGVPVELRAGRNELYVSGIRGSFRLVFDDPGNRLVIGTWDVDAPRLTRDIDGSAWYFSIIRPSIFNASTRAVESLHLHFGSPVPDHGDSEPVIDEWIDGRSIPPLSLIKPSVYFDLELEIPESLRFHAALFPIEVYTSAEDRARALLRVDLLEPEPSAPRQGLRNPARDEALTRHGLDPLPAGPFAELLQKPCFLVRGTAGDDAEDQALLARARYDLQRLWSRYNFVPELITDEELFRRNALGRRRFSNAILYGNEDTNSALRWLVPKDFPCRVKRGRVRRNGELREGEDLLCLFTFESSVYGADARFEVGVVADSGPVGCRLGYGLSLWESEAEIPAEGLLLDPGFLASD